MHVYIHACNTDDSTVDLHTLAYIAIGVLAVFTARHCLYSLLYDLNNIL